MFKKVLTVVLMMSILAYSFIVPSNALTKNEGVSSFSVVSTNLTSNQYKAINLSREDLLVEKTETSANEFSETYEGIFAIDMQNNIELVDSVPPLSRTTQESTEENVYWKARIKIVYTVSGDTVVLTKVEGSWSQLRGTTTIVYRDVSYGQMLLVSNNDSDLKFPTTNTFSYNTGFSAGRYINNKSTIGANTLMKYRRSNASTEFSLAVRSDVNF